MPQYGLELTDNSIVCYASLRSITDRDSHLELHKIAEAHLIKEKVKFNLCNLLFKNLK